MKQREDRTYLLMLFRELVRVEDRIEEHPLNFEPTQLQARKEHLFWRLEDYYKKLDKEKQ